MEQATHRCEGKNKGNWKLKPEIIYGFIGLIIVIGIIIFASKTAPPASDNNSANSEQEIRSETPTKTNIPSPSVTITLLEQDKQTINDAIKKVLVSYAPPTVGNSDTIDYSKMGWSKPEPLIREIDYNDNGVLSIWFSAWTDGNSYMDTSDYNTAEEEVGYILAKLKTLSLYVPLTHVAIEAWGVQQDLGCSKTEISRMLLAEYLTATQLQSFQTDGMDNMTGNDIFNSMKSQGIITEIDDSTRVCGHN